MTNLTDGVATPMTAEQRAEFEREGFLVIRSVLSGAEVEFYAGALDRVYQACQEEGTVAPGGAMHLLSAVANCPETAELIDHPQVFGLVWSVLGWNIHIYHSHLDVHPPIVQQRPFRYEWHQDGGRQNRETETDPRPRLSVKLAFWLSDVSEPGRGNFKVWPGSHIRNRIDGPPRRDIAWPDPDGATEVCANPGDVVFFDRRLWHARSDNYSQVTRKAAFFAYTPRWVTIRDDTGALRATPGFAQLSPVRRQLLGGIGAGIDGQAEGDHLWGHYPRTTPLYSLLSEHGLLDPANLPLRGEPNPQQARLGHHA